jgi:hypothetical protein
MTTLLATYLVLSAASFDSLPDGKGLVVRVVKYEGSSNGGMTIEVKNPTGSPLTFDPTGIYFVPNMNPANAPQRLGAVGSHTVNVAPGALEKMTLDVYCIDSHRSGPNESTPFRVAKDRIPVSLSNTITESAAKASAPYGGIYSPAPAAKSAVQGEVWRNRDAKWIKLDGEGAQEAGKR